VIGFAAAQIALLRGVRVIASAGETFAGRLRDLGATVVPYGATMVESVLEAAGGPPDLVFDAAPVNMRPDLAAPGGVLPDLVRIAGGDPGRVITCADFAGAAALGVRTGLESAAATGLDGSILRWDALGEFARLAAEGRFTIPIARTFPLEAWRDALETSQSGHAHGKLVLLPGG
jgi:NADPH:quinone reductase-like Zn-dependent oxidoreductase